MTPEFLSSSKNVTSQFTGLRWVPGSEPHAAGPAGGLVVAPSSTVVPGIYTTQSHPQRKGPDL
jgi:hypothetical protein